MSFFYPIIMKKKLPENVIFLPENYEKKSLGIFDLFIYKIKIITIFEYFVIIYEYKDVILTKNIKYEIKNDIIIYVY
jgi:hypothetical protein